MNFFDYDGTKIKKFLFLILKLKKIVYVCIKILHLKFESFLQQD